MNTTETLHDLRSRILAGYPVLLLRTYEEQRWEEELAELAGELERGLVTWSLALGAQPTLGGYDAREPLPFLEQIPAYPEDHLFLLKDLHPHLEQPAVRRKLRDLLPILTAQRKTLLMMSPVEDLPVELVKDVTVIDLPLPGPAEILSDLQQVLQEHPALADRVDSTAQSRLVQGVLGLTLAEAHHAFGKVLAGQEEFSDELLVHLVTEKRHLIQGSNLLEFFDLDDGLDDIGGLDGLKEWIVQRAAAFSAAAREQGIRTPKGVLLAGVQGCGKSLSARAIARILGFPLVRLDIGALLETTRGSSEQNLRDVLRLMETIAPAVLWLEEIDKAFAGVSTEAKGDATLSRMFGRFLTWLQEHTSPVFVVATANEIAGLPPEMLRRGRFDDLFFIDLPNFEERQSIFRIHLSKRGWKPEKFDLDELSNATSGYSGAEIEQVVNTSIIESYAAGRMPTQGDLLESVERTIPLSVTMEDEIFALREWARTRCRPATLDHRVIQVMEEEERRGEVTEAQPATAPRWQELIEHGQLAAGVIEYVRYHDHVTWAQLLRDLAPFTPVTGEFGIALRADPKVAIWLRLSKELADVCCDYIDGKRLYLHPVVEGTYPANERPQLPTITQMSEERTPKPVWLPTTLRLVPPAQGSGRLRHVIRIRMGKAN